MEEKKKPKRITWKMPSWKLKKLNWKFQMPQLKLWQRLFLYVVMIGTATLALVNVALNCFHFLLGILFYVLAALTLFPGIYYLIFDVRDIAKGIKGFALPKIEANPYTNQVAHDYRLRTVVSSIPDIITSVLYAGFNGVMGIVTGSAWLGSMSAYYLLLAVMRIGAVRQERRIAQIEDEKLRLKKEDAIYRTNSSLFIFLAIVLGGIVILLVNSIGGEEHAGYSIYVVALYTFYKVVKNFIIMAKDRKNNSPLITIILKVDYIDSLVSILMLQTALFAAFGEGQEELIKTMNLFTGIGICLLVLFAGVQGIVVSGKRRKQWKRGNIN